MPKSWTFETLLDCVRDYVRRVSNDQRLDISQLYYKKNRCKTVVQITGDEDIKSLLDHFPMKRVGRNKLVATMYLAVDLKGEQLIIRNFLWCFDHAMLGAAEPWVGVLGPTTKYWLKEINT